jgi:hypothetical protein
MWKKYRKHAVTEIMIWSADVSMDAISVSPEDRASGHPRTGDMVARNPSNHSDMWLMTEAFFKANYEAVE